LCLGEGKGLAVAMIGMIGEHCRTAASAVTPESVAI
jgi:hypothetical protein